MKGDHNSFIYKFISSEKIVKMKHKYNEKDETFHGYNLLPCFQWDLCIVEDCNISNLSYSQIGDYYQRPQGVNKCLENRSKFLAGQENFLVD